MPKYTEKDILDVRATLKILEEQRGHKRSRRIRAIHILESISFITDQRCLDCKEHWSECNCKKK